MNLNGVFKMDARKLTAIIAVLMMLFASNVLLCAAAQGTDNRPAKGLTAIQTPGQVMNAPSSRAFNTTEFMGYTTATPTIDGSLNAGEWADAAVYNIGGVFAPVNLYIMFDDNKIYVAIDAIGDVTQDTTDPPGGYITDPTADTFEIVIDGEGDGKLTYTDPDSTDGIPGENAIDWFPPGNCVDRWAATSGGSARMAGWINDVAGGNPEAWNSAQAKPNQGAQEPFDYINPGFNTHRTYEYSIPYTGAGDELRQTKGGKVGISIVLNDVKGGQIGRIPNGAQVIRPPFQEFNLIGKPKAKIEPLASSIYYAGETVVLDGSKTTDPQGDTLTYAWDFDFDGTNFHSGATTPSTNYIYTVEGLHTIALKATNTHGAVDIATTKVTIVQPEYAPALTNMTPIDPWTIDEGTTQVLSASYDDKNLRQASEHLYGQWFLNDQPIRSFDAIKAGKTSYTFKTNYTGLNSAGKYHFELKVNDTYTAFGKFTGGSQYATMSWNLTVKNINRAPTILTHSPDADPVITDEVTKTTYSITRSDPDSDPMTVTWYVDNKVQSGTGDAFTYLNLPDYNTYGKHQVKVVVKDGGDPPLNTTFSWNVTVNNVDRSPIIKTFTPTSLQVTVDEGKSQEFKVTADDPDLATAMGDTLSYIWALNGINIDGATTGTYTFKTDYNSSIGQDYELKVVVTDQFGLNVNKQWTITVRDIDRPPVVRVRIPLEGESYTLSETVTFDATKTNDPDGDPLTFTWLFGDSSSRTLVASAPATHRYNNPGQYTVQLIVNSTHKKQLVEVDQIINITIKAAQLEVKDITTDLSKLTEGQKLTITVHVMNTGSLDEKDMTVKLFMDTTIPIDTKDHQTIKAGGNYTTTFTWDSKGVGTHSFNAVLTGDKDTMLTTKPVKSFDVVVQKKAQPILGGGGGGFPWWIIVLLLVVIVVVVVMFAVVSSRKKAKRQAEENARVEAEKAKAEDARKQAEAAAYAAAVQQQYQPAYPSPPPQHMVIAPPPPPPPPPPPAASPFVSRRARRREEEEEEPVRPVAKVEVTPEMAKAAAEAGICPSCGEAVEKGWSRCSSCDQKLLVPAAPTVAAPRPPPPPPPAAMPKAPPPPPPKPVAAPPPPAPAGGLTKCPSCGDEVEPDWVKCPSCGKGLAGGAAASKPASKAQPKCPKCGEDLEPEWTKCPFCSTML
jgi:predicted RNA-binding Zn-ribbon protein involved in translation (DUF1610 family)